MFIDKYPIRATKYQMIIRGFQRDLTADRFLCFSYFKRPSSLAEFIMRHIIESGTGYTRQ